MFIMTTLFMTHPSSLEHDTGPGHPESARRLKAVLTALDDPAFDALVRHTAPRGSVWDIKRVHDDAYIQSVFDAVPESGFASMDGDTVLSPGSGEAALFAVGAACRAVDAVVAGEVKNAFVAVRPPGHHAERDRAMGFCLFNNAAIAAFHAREIEGIERVAVVDFDVHHGNGTQQAFWNEETLFYASSHQSPCYPGTGSERERGAFGNIVNAALPPGAGGDDLRDAYGFIMPALRDFAPDLLILSAGFDAHARDPLAQLMLAEADYDWLMDQLLALAEAQCGGRVVSFLEGGYDVDALASCVRAHVLSLMAA